MEIAQPSDTCPLWITKVTIVSMSRCIRLSDCIIAPFHWFNQHAYLKLGVWASCQLHYHLSNNDFSFYRVDLKQILAKHQINWLNKKRECEFCVFVLYYHCGTEWVESVNVCGEWHALDIVQHLLRFLLSVQMELLICQACRNNQSISRQFLQTNYFATYRI